jgi:hypothetical protein
MTAGKGFNVISGVPELLSEVPGHVDAEGIERLAFPCRSGIEQQSPLRIAVHYVCAEPGSSSDWIQIEPETHPLDEINLLLPSRGGRLSYRYEIDGEVLDLDGPCAVVIHGGMPHRMRLESGSGLFVCLRLQTVQSA